MILYKLTDQNNETGHDYNIVKWGKNVTHKAKLGKGELCSRYYIHAYTHPLLAVLFNPIHANIKNPVLWKAEGRIAINDGLKVDCKKLTTIKEIELPEITIEQKVTFAIYCALEGYKEPNFEKWANNWLEGNDKTAETARAAAEAARAAATDASEEINNKKLIELAIKAMRGEK